MIVGYLILAVLFVAGLFAYVRVRGKRVIGLRKHAMAFDFEHAYLPAARAVLAGHSPYPPATVAAFFPKTAFIYPPLTAYLVAPFTLVSAAVADAVVSALAIGLVIGIL